MSINISTKISETSWSTPTEYFYVRNYQGDIIGLIDKAGTQVVSYTYDSWGKLISIKDATGVDITNTITHVGYKNCYRYRGYRYDTETGLYYLQSRYYNSEWGRFINADGIVGQTGELLGHNLFAYCKNNPVNMKDEDGFRALPAYGDEEIIAAIAVVVTVFWTASKAASTLIKDTVKSVVSSIPHGNSKSNNKPQHGYEIYHKKTGDGIKVGISGGKIRKDGKSYRAEKQVRDFNRRESKDIYESRIMGFFPDRQSALEWEWLDSQFVMHKTIL
ncbi:RHS repeat-associated core domain-containing protein [Clostridium tunisiense]|uniref:RHS repeat-associated core domain-containing protein n=1 Tax=Clostridium tunisiense TaxID=219748 RepID=UPI0002EED4DD|nr:RHS repeat-associated core domain-containing protein [Clostridium tunisiense]